MSTVAALLLSVLAVGTPPASDQCPNEPIPSAACERFVRVETILVATCGAGRADACLELADLVTTCTPAEADRATDLMVRACAFGSPAGCMRTGDRATSPAARQSWYRRAEAIFAADCTGGDHAACIALNARLRLSER